MTEIVAIGEQERLRGFALAGVEVARGRGSRRRPRGVGGAAARRRRS